jgi:hypothetical protein
MEPTLSYLKQLNSMGHEIMGNLCVQPATKENFCRLLGHHSNNPRVEQQNMVLLVINPTSPNIT